jgi:membrane protein, antimicrobial resistance system
MSTPAPAQRPPSLWEDLLEIFYAPTAVFERRRETPSFGLALVVFVVLIVGLSFAFKGLTEPVFDAEFKRGMAQALKQNPKLTPEMVTGFRETAKKFVLVGITVYGFITPFILGILLWLVGKVLDSKAAMGQTIMVATYAMFPRVVETILNAVQLLVLPEDSIKSRFGLTFGVGRFLDPDQASPYLMAILGRVDLFTLWVTLLLGIGLAVMGRIPRERAFVGAALMWVIGALPGLWGAMRAAG